LHENPLNLSKNSAKLTPFQHYLLIINKTEQNLPKLLQNFAKSARFLGQNPAFSAQYCLQLGYCLKFG
jgi:hypothetical protein